MAREDTRWFVVGVVVLSAVLFFALPFSILVYIETAKLRSEINYEIRQLSKLKQEVKKELKEKNEKGNSTSGAADTSGL